MKNSFAAVAAILLAAAPLSAVARPYVPHHTSAATAHRHNGVHHRHHHHDVMHGHRHHSSKAERMHRRANTHHFGNPNSRNPSQEGYQQQLGNTTNGPRY